MRSLAFLLALLVASTAAAQYPDGTLVFSNKQGPIGRIAKRIAGGDHYTHVGVVIDGFVYESDWPRAKRTPVAQYGKPRTTNDYYVPTSPYTPQQIAAMRSQANGTLGQPYRLRSYFRPGAASRGTWCSPWTGRVLQAAGENLTSADYHEPQNLLQRVQGNYRFSRQIKR